MLYVIEELRNDDRSEKRMTSLILGVFVGEGDAVGCASLFGTKEGGEENVSIGSFSNILSSFWKVLY